MNSAEKGFSSIFCCSLARFNATDQCAVRGSAATGTLAGDNGGINSMRGTLILFRPSIAIPFQSQISDLYDGWPICDRSLIAGATDDVLDVSRAVSFHLRRDI